MRSTLFLSAAAALALIATDPAFCMQDMNPPPPADPMAPEQPAPPSAPPAPGEPMPAPMPGEPMPIPAPSSAPQPPVEGSTDAPVGPMATPPSTATDSAQSGGTTSSMMTPQPATKEYPLCTKTLQDNCRNPGEGPKAKRNRR